MNKISTLLLMFFVFATYIKANDNWASVKKTPTDDLGFTGFNATSEHEIDFHKLHEVLSNHLKEKYLPAPDQLKNYAELRPAKGYYFLNIHYVQENLDIFIHEIRRDGFKIWITPVDNQDIPIENLSKYFKVMAPKGTFLGGIYDTFKVRRGLGYSWELKGG